MIGDWQSLTVLAIVAAAAGWLAYRAYATMARKRQAGCGACSTCPVENTKSEPQVVAIETPRGLPVIGQTSGGK